MKVMLVTEMIFSSDMVWSDVQYVRDFGYHWPQGTFVNAAIIKMKMWLSKRRTRYFHL